jgi:hypothetical protein
VHALTDSQPPGWTSYARRVDAEMLAEVAPAPAERPRFVKATETALAELLARPLGDLDLVALMIDGVHFGRDLPGDGHGICPASAATGAGR